jgi:hypothetical protein
MVAWAQRRDTGIGGGRAAVVEKGEGGFGSLRFCEWEE